ncbi:MAG: HPr family phosphocarrier protein [Geodermatophilaceae bacterium]|jgi:phosphocarrier protein|nr:HPr family phosphocarrier protein [Geodermatophilaceae bacterium]
MPERRAVVASKVGLHARPAALFAKAAAEQTVTVTIAVTGVEGTQDRGPVDASSILGLMTLGAKHGDEVVLAAEGEGAESALETLAELVAQDLDA